VIPNGRPINCLRRNELKAALDARNAALFDRRKGDGQIGVDEGTALSTESVTLSIPWQKATIKRLRKILRPNGTLREHIRPNRTERRVRLVRAIARGRRWLDEIVSGSVTDAEYLAKRERCTVRQINLTLSLAFLAPQLVKAAVEGRLPRGINIERLRDPHAEWGRQFEELGLDPD
jgi:site-specific DNA recombinase